MRSFNKYKMNITQLLAFLLATAKIVRAITVWILTMVAPIYDNVIFDESTFPFAHSKSFAPQFTSIAWTLLWLHCIWLPNSHSQYLPICKSNRRIQFPSVVIILAPTSYHMDSSASANPMVTPMNSSTNNSLPMHSMQTQSHHNMCQPNRLIHFEPTSYSTELSF